EPILVNLAEHERIDQIHIRGSAKVVAEVTECQNARALSTLSEAVVRKKRRNLDFRSRVWYRAEVDCAGRTPFGEVLARKRCVGTAIDRPVERFAKAAPFCRRRRRRRNQKPGLPWPVLARDGDVRHIEQRNVFQSERGPSRDDPFIRIDDSSSESKRPPRPRPVAGCDSRILELVLTFLGSMRLLGCNKKPGPILPLTFEKSPAFVSTLKLTWLASSCSSFRLNLSRPSAVKIL